MAMEEVQVSTRFLKLPRFLSEILQLRLHSESNNPSWTSKGYSCPVNNLPPELLLRVFQYGVCAGCDNGRGVDLHSAWTSSGRNLDNITGTVGLCVARPLVRPFPDLRGSFSVLVSHVCRYWRNIAISNPSLWTTITHSWADTGFVRPSPSHCDIVYTLGSYLERSQDLPIDIDFRRVRSLNLSSSLIPHVHRWRSVNIDFGDAECAPAFLHSVSQPAVPAACQLVSLRLRHGWIARPFSYFQPFLPLFGGFAPLLKSITLDGVPVNWDQPWISSASNLVCLELGDLSGDTGPSWVQLLAILRGAPKLQKLALSFRGTLQHVEGWFIPADARTKESGLLIQLPDLTHLALNGEALGLIQNLDLPSLKHLDLFPHLFFSDDESLCRAFNRLESLRMNSHPGSTEQVARLYKQLHNLKALQIQTYFITDSPNIFEMLYPQCLPSTGQDKILPSLEKLHVSGALVPHSYDLRKIVQSRKDAGHPLKSLHLEQLGPGDHDSELSDWLRDNLEDFTSSWVLDTALLGSCDAWDYFDRIFR